MDLSRISLNSITVRSLTLCELIDACASRGITAVAPWRDLLLEPGVDQAARWLADAGMAVSSLCRGGMFTSMEERERRLAVEDNMRAIEEAATLGAGSLILVCGPVVGKDVAGSYSMVRDGIGSVLEMASQMGVTLAIEPLHPMMAADRSVIARVDDAVRLIAELEDHPRLAIAVDAYHVWWDLGHQDALSRGAGRISALQVSDWVTPITGGLTSGRRMLGNGVIDLPSLAADVSRAGYSGPVEVEILSDHWWAQPVDAVLD